MNGVHLLTQEKNESKRIENGPSAPSALPKASPGAQAARPAAQLALPRTLRVRPRLLPLTCSARACLSRPLRSARLARLRPRTARCRAPPAARPERPAPQPAAAPCASCPRPCAPCPRPCAPRLSYRGPNGRVVGAGCAPARPHRRHRALHAPTA